MLLLNPELKLLFLHRKWFLAIKDGTISEEEYAKQYRELMLRSYD